MTNHIRKLFTYEICQQRMTGDRLGMKVHYLLTLLNRKGLFSDGRKKEQLEVFEESEIQREC